ncbi:MAG: hypothetical protein RL570_566 [Actinomycetota bacterium]|jgi:hypothetical protein
MKFKFKKLASLLTSSLLVAGGLVGLASAPAIAAPTVIDYENPANSYTITKFGSGTAGVETNPPAGVSNSLQAIKYVRGSETWNGATILSLSSEELISTDSSSSLFVSAKVWSSVQGNIRLKLEDKNDSTKTIEAQVSTSGGSTWETVTWDFNSVVAGTAAFDESRNYDKASIFFDFDSTTAGGVYWFDDFTYSAHALAQAPSIARPATLSTFESGDTNTYDTTQVCSTTAEVTNSPPAGGSAGSSRAGKITFTSGPWCDQYPLWTFLEVPAGQSLVSSTQNVVRMNFYSQTGGETPLLKFNTGPNNAGPLEAFAAETVIPGWQTLSFTFQSVSDTASYRLVTLFPQGNSVTTPRVSAYYFDDVSFNGTTTPAVVGGGAQQLAPTVNYDVRLASNLKDTAVDAYEWTDCGGQSWCANNNYYMKMISAGSSTTLSYVVTEHGTTTPVNGAVVRLRMNTGYSGSNATWSAGQSSFAAVATSDPNDAGYIEATSNAQGVVTFTFTNTNTSGEAARTLNNANPYPAGCLSPAGQTKAALQPTVHSVSGATIGTQYVDVLWPHISSATINTSIAAGSDGTNCGVSGTSGIVSENKGEYPHIRLDKQFLDTKFDASWWDGVWQYRDADTKAYLKYIPVGSTFRLTYHVTDASNQPMVGAAVELIVNANYSCSKTFFLYENSLIGPDDCAGGGETVLPAKLTDKDGNVTFVLTNTNATGEAMPADLNGLPNGKELGTNIKPNLVGATTQGIDMLFAHFVEPSEKSKVTAPAEVTRKAGESHWSTFTFTDEQGKPIVGEIVEYYINGFDSKRGYKRTDGNGQVTVQSNNFGTSEGIQAIAVSLIRPEKLPLTATAKVNWTSAEVALTAAGGKRLVTVKALNAANKVVKIVIAGKTYIRRPVSDSATYRIATSAGKKKVTVSVGGQSVSKTLTVAK